MVCSIYFSKVVRLYWGLRESAKATVDNLTADAERATQHHFADLDLIERTYGASPFWLACQRGDLNEIEEGLLNASSSSSSSDSNSTMGIGGNDLNGQSTQSTSMAELVASVDCRGVTPLLAASSSGNTAVVKVLLRHGARVDVCALDGAHPLYAAAQLGHADVCQTLLEEATGAAADVLNRPGNESGWSPCLVAAWHGHVKVFEGLLKHGADRCQPSTAPFSGLPQNATPLMAANAQGHAAIAALLQEQDQGSPHELVEQHPSPSPLPAAPLTQPSNAPSHEPEAEATPPPVPTFAAQDGDAKSTAESADHHHERLVAFYTRHEPSKVAQVDKLLVKYRGREAALWSQLEAKYGREEFTSP